MTAALFSHFRCQRAMPLDTFLRGESGLSKSRAEWLTMFGGVYVDGKRTRENIDLQPGQIVRVHFQPKRYAVPSSIPVIYEDPELICVDKPSGLPTHPTLDNYIENACSQMQLKLGTPVYVTHRLDIATEGLLVLAKSKASQAEINRLFEKRRVTKVYRTFTEAPPPMGRLRHYMQIDVPAPKPVSVDETDNSRQAVLNVRKVWWSSEMDAYACELELETGRTHQIRAQLAFIGCPIVGDALYGSKRKFVHERFALECFHISFTHRSRTIGLYRPTPLVAPQPTKDSEAHS